MSTAMCGKLSSKHSRRPSLARGVREWRLARGVRENARIYTLQPSRRLRALSRSETRRLVHTVPKSVGITFFFVTKTRSTQRIMNLTNLDCWVCFGTSSPGAQAMSALSLIVPSLRKYRAPRLPSCRCWWGEISQNNRTQVKGIHS